MAMISMKRLQQLHDTKELYVILSIVAALLWLACSIYTHGFSGTANVGAATVPAQAELPSIFSVQEGAGF